MHAAASLGKRRFATLAVAMMAVAGLSVPARADDHRFAPRRVDPGAHAFQFRLGGFFPSGGDDVWTDNEDFFTFDVDDLSDAMIGVSYVSTLAPSLELGFNADYYDGSTFSAERGLFDEFGLPIVHDTRLTLMPLTADLRIAPGARRARRNAHPLFYFGAGIGLAFWRYEEAGEFVDFADPSLPIYAGVFNESGVALETHVLAGLEMPVHPNWGLTLEGRYSWSDDDLDGVDFPDFGRLNLGGPSLFVGGTFRF